MAGLRHWKGTGYGFLEEFVGSHFYTLPIMVDTQFTVQVINAGIIRFPFFNPGITFNLISEDTTNKFLTFASCISVNYLSSISVHYYYDADSIVYSNIWSVTGGKEYEYLTIHTP